MTDPVLKPWEKRATSKAAKPWEKYGLANGKGLTGAMGGVEQFGAGLNEGLAGFAGTPVDLMTSAINFGTSGINKLAGTEIPQITDPVGGSGTFRSIMDPVISDRQPENTVERYLRRGGQEVGFGVPAALTGAAIPGYGAVAREAFVPYMAASTAGDVGAGIGGQTAQEIAPGNATADLIASMIGGAGGAGLAAAFTPKLEAVPTLDDLKRKNAADWQKVRAAPETLTDNATAGLDNAVRDSLPTSQLADEAYPNAFGMADKMAVLKNPSIYDVEEARRIIGDRVAASPQEARVGVEMKRSIEDYLSTLKPTDLQGGTADDTLDALSAARKGTHQVKKAEAVLNKEMRAETRAATTGTGGNEVNATRQNIRALFDKERDPTLRGARQGFTPDEMAAMSGIVSGDAKSNIARLLGRLSPNSGALPLMASGGGLATAAAGLATGNPLMTLAAAPSMVGMVAKSGAESMTKDQIAKLMATILNGGKTPAKSAARAATQRAIVEQLLSTAGSNPQ